MSDKRNKNKALLEPTGPTPNNDIRLSVCGPSAQSIAAFDMTKLDDFCEITDGRRDFVYFGRQNAFPNFINDLFRHSALFESIVRGEIDYILGNRIVAPALASLVNRDGENIADIIEGIARDLVLYDGFALQIFRNAEGLVTGIYNIDFQCIRLNSTRTRAFYSVDWTNYSSASRYTVYNVWRPWEDGATEDFVNEQQNTIFYYKGRQAPQASVYPLPTYIGALNDIMTSIEISKFHLAAIQNGFNVSTILSFNSGEVDDDTKRRIERQINDKFSGAGNAGKIILNFNDSKETEPTIQKLTSDDFDKRYEALSKTVQQNIFTAFRAQPQLFGLRTDGALFNHDEYIEAAQLYQKTVIAPLQRTIERQMEKIFGGFRNVVKIIPFALDEVESSEAPTEQKTDTTLE